MLAQLAKRDWTNEILLGEQQKTQLFKDSTSGHQFWRSMLRRESSLTQMGIRFLHSKV
jgi:hypothetical protein